MLTRTTDDDHKPRRASDASDASGDTLYGADDGKRSRASSDASNIQAKSLEELESGSPNVRAHRRPQTPPEEQGFFASVRDTDADNDWDELDREQPGTGTPDGALGDDLYEQVLDPDDPLVTGVHKDCLEDPEDAEQEVWRQMSYRKRRKERARIRIEYNISCKWSSLCVIQAQSLQNGTL